MKALVLHQRQVHVLHSETNTHVQFVTALNTLYLKKKKLQRILIWKLNFRIKSEIIIMIIYTYRYMIFRYSNLKIDMNKYWYLAALKKSTYIVSVHIQVHTCISSIPYLVHLVVDTLCLVEHGMAGPSTQGQGSLGVECPPQLL